jgi:hypothetical protein
MAITSKRSFSNANIVLGDENQESKRTFNAMNMLQGQAEKSPEYHDSGKFILKNLGTC